MVRNKITEKLTQALTPAHLEVIDESHLHAGHSGTRPEGETHFRLRIVASAFAGLSRLQRQRKVMELLSEELQGPVHALAMRLKTPEEAASDTQ
ncbi:BolA family transcriptional regulator [Alphaproteobacteria bacterium]|nr:BolA family transcriptional regulator [Alphaproteobacteria bacterium]MDC0148342.1 BolA family transcriptional regulator [Alphaproteobacteria bacterium]MDC1241083.1 BolA family transcriptional regulator [bacterium]